MEANDFPLEVGKSALCHEDAKLLLVEFDTVDTDVCKRAVWPWVAGTGWPSVHVNPLLLGPRGCP